MCRGGRTGCYPVPPDSEDQHVIIVLQENRSHDSYFRTYPGADGTPRKNGVPEVVCSGSLHVVRTDLTWLRSMCRRASTCRPGYRPDCANESAETCAPVPQTYRTYGI